MAENGDVLEQIQTQLEGNTLGLSAVADVLQKMEARLEKAEDYEYEEDLQLAEEEQYDALIKGVAQEVIVSKRADDDDERRRARSRDEEEEEDEGKDAIIAMKKQLEELQKQVAGYQEGIQKSSDTQVIDRLERMGFREENGLAAPKIIPDETLGIESETFISKAEQAEDVVDQLSKLSFKELRVLQERVQSGDTEGIPTELLS